ncbi:hypothetical protein GF342_04590 [Candidatus Woesearchaeota archaeon]|nr:hypothetical protein [Candidatus Woesearchaeota archaeon]
MAKRSRSKSRSAAPRSSVSATHVGKVLFLAGVLLAILAGLVPNLDQFPWVVWVLAGLGFLIGVLNIEEKEQTPFLVAGIGLLVLAIAVNAFLPELGQIVAVIFKNIIAFVGTTMLVVSTTAIFNLARD